MGNPGVAVIPPKWAEFLSQQRKEWTEKNLGRKLRAVRHKPNGRVVIGSQELINFSSNDYLGLVGDMRVAEAAARAAGRYGWGTGSSRLVTGTSLLHNELENEIARFRGTEAALCFGSGYQANLGVISALVGPGDVIFSDALNHASIVAACKLSGAEVNVFEHRAYDDLETDLELSKTEGRRLIISDSLFSLEGSAADVERLLKICEKFEALLVLDDAHANGVLGKRGRGVADLQGVSAQLPIATATFSKGFGSYGGFVACSRELREFFINRSRPFAFTTSLPVALAAANLEALKIVNAEGEQLRQKLSGLVRTLRTKLAAAEFQPLGEHHIVPLVIGDEDEAVAFSDALESLGMLVYAMRYPAVAKGRAILRISLTAAHNDDDIYRLVNACKTARDRIKGKAAVRNTRRESRRPEESSVAEVQSTPSLSEITSLISRVADPLANAAPADAGPRPSSGEYARAAVRSGSGEFARPPARPRTGEVPIPPARPDTAGEAAQAPARKPTREVAPPTPSKTSTRPIIPHAPMVNMPPPAAETPAAPPAAQETPAAEAQAAADAAANPPAVSTGDTLLPEGVERPPKPAPEPAPALPPPSTEPSPADDANDSSKTLLPEGGGRTATSKVRKTQRRTRTQKRS